MTVITSYATLQSAVADELLRPDLTEGGQIQRFIRMAEHALRRDPRVKRLVSNATLTVSSEVTALPANFLGLEQLAHAGPTFFGPLHQGTAADLAGTTAAMATGVPRWFHVLSDQAAIQVGPPPDTTYSLAMDYWETIAYLGVSGVLQNWLLANHSDIYLYAACKQSAPYLREDPRLAVWGTLLEEGLEALNQHNDFTQFSGALSRQPAHRLP